MSAPTKFDLRRLIHHVCDTSEAPDPATLAQEVSKRTTDADLRAAYEQALPIAVQHTISQDRTRRWPFADPDESLVPAQRTSSEGRSGPALGPSRKAGARHAYAKELKQRFAFSFNPRDWKPFGDFTVEDCDSAAVMREKLAAGNQRKAAWMRKNGQLLRDHKVTIISNLPVAALAQIFDRDTR